MNDRASAGLVLMLGALAVGWWYWQLAPDEKARRLHRANGGSGAVGLYDPRQGQAAPVPGGLGGLQVAPSGYGGPFDAQWRLEQVGWN